MTARKTAVTALFACLICICSWISVPFAVPFTMQTFAVFCALLLLEGSEALIAVALYLAMGAVGLPVFSGFRGGIGHLVGPTGGFLFGFLMTALVYILLRKHACKSRKGKAAALAAGLFMCYLSGTVWFAAIAGGGLTAESILSAFSVCVLPFLLPDAVKLMLAVYVCGRVEKTVRHVNTGQKRKRNM